MKVTRIQDKYNPDKVWMIKRYLCGTFYVNQEIKGQKFYDRDRRAEIKKRMQDKGVLPPDKPKLNRKKFIDEAREEWNGRSSDCFIWEHYLIGNILKDESMIGQMSIFDMNNDD